MASSNPSVPHIRIAEEDVVVGTTYGDHENVPWKSVDVVGRGGFAEVDIVEHDITKVRLARKKTTLGSGRQQQSNQDKRDSFKREVVCLERLDGHLHIVQFVESYSYKNTLAILLLPVADMDLDDYMDKFPIPGQEEDGEQLLRRAFGCLASALAYMHEKGIRHKDVKPQNILVHHQNVLFADFGLGFDFKDIGNSVTTGQPQSLTFKYSAQEIKDYDDRGRPSDVFSLGCIFLEMATTLAGKSLYDLDQSLIIPNTENEKHNGSYSHRLEQARAWIEGLQNDNLSSLPLRWTNAMMQNNAEARPSMADLIDRRSRINQSIGLNEWRQYFCQNCSTASATVPALDHLSLSDVTQSQVSTQPLTTAKISSAPTTNKLRPPVQPPKASKQRKSPRDGSLLSGREEPPGWSDWSWSPEHQQYYAARYNALQSTWEYVWQYGSAFTTAVSEPPSDEYNLPASNDHQFSRMSDSEPTNAIWPNSVALDLKNSSSPPLSPSTVDQGVDLLGLLPSGTVSSHKGLDVSSGSQDVSNSYDYPGWSPSTTYNLAPKYDLLGYDVPGFDSRNTSETTSRAEEVADYQPSGRIIRGDGTQREQLDPSYKQVRSAARFFKIGRVFSMLWTEPVGATRMSDEVSNDDISVVRLGEAVFSSIRRFVVVKGSQYYCLCSPISTYGGRGVTKRGVIAKDHTIIYTGDQAPDRLEGEEAMYKEPIRVIPDPGALLDSRSRLNFGKVYTVEHNVKVKNIGVVDKMDIPKLEKAHLALLLQE